jgi:hypothetical protein
VVTVRDFSASATCYAELNGESGHNRTVISSPT